MNYKRKYEGAVRRARNLLSPTIMEEIFLEFKDDWDEKIIAALISVLKSDFEEDTTINDDITVGDIIAWLEKINKIDLSCYDYNELEKRNFVGHGFLKCTGNFLLFKEGELYWLEYVGKDNYNVRSDNLLGQTFKITPRQLYTMFQPSKTWSESKKKFELINEDGIDIESGRMLNALSQGLRNILRNDYWNDFGGVPIEELEDWVKRQCEKLTIGNRKIKDEIIVGKGKFKVGDYSKFNPKFKVGDIITSSKNKDLKYLIKEVGVKNELGEFDYVVEHIADDEYKGRINRMSINKVDTWGILVEPEDKNKWTEEDANILNDIIDYIQAMPIFFESFSSPKSGREFTKEFVKHSVKWLKSIKDRIYPKSQWGEKDDEMFNLLHYCINEESVSEGLRSLAIRYGGDDLTLTMRKIEEWVLGFKKRLLS